MCTPLFTPTCAMETPTIINLMRNMNVNHPIALEEVHNAYPDVTKLYRGRPEMLIFKMTNGRNMQLFRGGKVQILGRVPDTEVENMRLELIMKLRSISKTPHSQVTPVTVSNLVMSVQLKKTVCLRKINLTNANFFHEIELFPAALIRKWHPVHIAVFHTGKVILTGLKSVEHFYDIMSSLTSFLEVSHVFTEK